MIIKFIHHSGKKRQTKVEKIPTYQEARQIAIKVWGQSVAQCMFAYTDEEDDMITICDQDDWNICLEDFNSKSAENKLEKIVISILDEDENFESVGEADTSKMASQMEMAQEVTNETISAPVEEEQTKPVEEKDEALALHLQQLSYEDQLDQWKMVSGVQDTRFES